MTLNEEAIVLTRDGHAGPQDRNLTKLLDFFGISWRTSTAIELFTDHKINQTGLRLLCSSNGLSDIISEIEGKSDRIQKWQQKVHSVFAYTGDDVRILGRLAAISPDSSYRDLTVSTDLPEFCGVMRGLRIPCESSTSDRIFRSPPPKGNVEIISSGRGAVFVGIEYEGVPIFLCSSSRIIDVETELPDGIFDLRAHVLQALPAVLYIKWAFPATAWAAPETNACLIIDDPLLRPTYGFVDYGELLSLMRRYKFSTNIAFIPWNWRRSDPVVTRLFRENPEYYSISVHGYAHTKAEFGSDDSDNLYRKTRQALERMSRHESATGIAHDRVMVFPQGVFSEAAMGVLKQTDLIAAVNNDTFSADKNHRPITIADVWDTAIMAYASFPLFTRRYPWSGIENFAFDSLLGKPVVIVVHHDFCRDHCVRLVEFIERLNALARPVRWRSLGELVKRSYRQRVLSPEVTEVEMYGKELRIQNQSDRTKQFLVRKRESTPSMINEIFAGTRRTSWEISTGRIHFEVNVKAGEDVTIGLHFHELGEVKSAEKLSYKARTMLRRYLCEMRDNYVHKITYRIGTS